MSGSNGRGRSSGSKDVAEIRTRIPQRQNNILEQAKRLKGRSKSEIITLALEEFIRSGKIRFI